MRTKFAPKETPEDINWHLHIVEIPDLEKTIKKIQSAMATDKPYYFNIYDEGKTLIVVFKNKIFNLNPNDKNSWNEARAYGTSRLGISKEQLDFYPSKISEENSWFNKGKILTFIKKHWKLLDSNLLQTAVVFVVGIFAAFIAYGQNNISKQLINLSYSPEFNVSLKITPFESDLKIENIGRVSLHNIIPEFADIYFTKTSLRQATTTIYDLEPGDLQVVPVPGEFKTGNKTILVEMCYLFNDNPLKKIDSSINLDALKEDPNYEAARRVQVYKKSKCSNIYIKYDPNGMPKVM
ncbi:MAG: hypothetical protein PHN74_02405 [Candidatus Pacebacteria bacterium]|nr:hypothetical protein [Candidatus Paceibacterota bacterium]